MVLFGFAFFTFLGLGSVMIGQGKGIDVLALVGKERRGKGLDR